MAVVTRIPAHDVESSRGEVMTPFGFAPVLNSNPERQSAASASFGMWEIGYKLPGRPCFRIFCAPSDLLEVRRESES
jgi:hypothetical protein